MDKKLPLMLLIAVTAQLHCYGQGEVGTGGISASHSRMNIKTNLLYDATASMNLGVEFRLGEKSSLDVSGNWNPFTFSDNRKWKHILVQPELRLWTKETFSGHFFGLHGHYAYYNVGNLPKPFSQNMRDHRYEGWLAGAGVSYGYRWNFNRHWGMEATLGVGYAYMDYAKYECGNCGEKLGERTRNYFGPTKAGISLIYSMGGKKRVVQQPEPVVVQPAAPLQEPKRAAAPPVVPSFEINYITPAVEAVKRRSEAGQAYLDFAVGRADITPSFKNNAFELQKIYNLVEEVKNDPYASITGISITGYASPEGSYQSNLTLSQRRASALKAHIRALYGFPENLFTVRGMGEDWEMLDTLVSASSMADRYRILEIIRGTDIFDGREKKLMALSDGNPYRHMLADMFPQLRRSDYRLNYTVEPFTVEKGKEVLPISPGNLSLNELFMIANTYTPGSDNFNEVFETAARIFPTDDTANLNAASSALERRDTASASRYLSKVTLKGRGDTYYNSMGVLLVLMGEYGKADAEFERAAASGHAQGVRNRAILREFTAAMENYGKNTPSH